MPYTREEVNKLARIRYQNLSPEKKKELNKKSSRLAREKRQKEKVMREVLFEEYRGQLWQEYFITRKSHYIFKKSYKWTEVNLWESEYYSIDWIKIKYGEDNELKITPYDKLFIEWKEKKLY